MAPIKLILDTDPGVDDVLALFLLLASPEVELLAITITFGNTTLPKASKNIFKVYQLIQKHLDAHPEDSHRFPNFKPQRRPIFANGAAGPLQGRMDLAEYFHGPDGLSDISTSDPKYDVDPDFWTESNPYLEVTSRPAHEVIKEIIEREPAGTVTILACGPLTNISRAITSYASFGTKIRRLVSMGGALESPGNTSATSEFNFFADPYAAQHILDCAQGNQFPFVLVPLDITGRHTIDFNWLIPPQSKGEKAIESFISTLLRRPRIILNQLGLPDHFEMHDPLAAWYTICTSGEDVEPGWGTVKRKFVVEKIGEYTKGMCIVDRRGTLEEVGATRATDGITRDVHEASSAEGVDVLLRWPDKKNFVEQMMKRVFWYSPATATL